ncbi:3'-5' RNA exonuclease complex component, partial [Coemansia sp. RSA 2424]
MQSRLWSKALCPATAGLCSRSSRQIVAHTRRRIQTAGGEPSTSGSKQYPELEDILGEPATTFEQLIGQLETLIKHPNPPRNYADALAKEELRRMDHRDLTTDKASGEHDPSRTRLLRQRPRMLRHMNAELDRGLNADDAGVGAGQDELTDMSDIPDTSSNVSSTHEVPPLPEEVAINLGITAEQQERRRIWMTKIAGYRAFRSNLMSMDSLLNSLNERREAERADFGMGERASDDLDEDRMLGPRFDSDALLDDDRKFEELIRKSWKLYDEDFADPSEASIATASDLAESLTKPSHSGSAGAGGVIPGKRSYHTTRTVYSEPDPSKKPPPPPKARVNNYASKITGGVKEGAAASRRDSDSTRPFTHRRLVIRGSGAHPVKGSRNLIRRVTRPSLKDLKRHFDERDEYADEVHVPIDATVSTGDIIEMRQTAIANSATKYGVCIALGGVVQKTTGRFHFNYVGPTRGVVGGREARLGFVAKGLLFDRQLLHRSGVASKDIKRILEYGEELREYEAEHGQHVLTSAQEAQKLQRTFSQHSIGSLVDNDVEIGANLAMPGVLVNESLPECQVPEPQDGVEADSEESISDLLVRAFPRALRTFQQDAEQLMRTHIRELGDYWGMALYRGQTHVTIDSLAQLTFGKAREGGALSEVERFAAYMHMVSDPLHYIPDADGLFVTCRFELRSRTEVENIVRVRDLIRENAPEFTQFIEKARSLVAYAHATMPLSPLRAALDPTAKSARATSSCKLTGWTPDLSFAKRKLPAGPALTEEEVANMKFTAEDSQFLLALRSYVFHSNAGFQNLANPYECLVSPILKKMNYYSGCDETSVARFLVDLGVWPHWYNQKLNMRDQHHGGFNRYRNKYLVERGAIASAALYYWGHPGSVDVDSASTTSKPRVAGERQVTECKNDVKLASQAVPEVRSSIITQSSSGVGIIGKSKLYGRDICEEIRHDFGDLPVYTIDDSTTRDVDDGLSLETIVTLGGEEQEWIHVHIADPTALIHPGHLIAHAAAQQMATIYYATETRNMLPLGMVLDNISLVRRFDSSGPKPANTMTMSCRLGDDGDIVDYKIRPGIVRNIIATPYEVVDQHLSFERPMGGMDSLARLQESKRMSTFIHPFVPTDAELPRYGANKTALPREAVQTLRRIQELTRRHYDFRVRSGAFTRLLPSIDITINEGANVAKPTYLMQRPVFLQTPHSSPEFSPLVYPKIVSSYSSVVVSPAHTMVAEMMIIAGR